MAVCPNNFLKGFKLVSEVWLAFFQEGGCSFFEIFCSEAFSEFFDFYFEAMNAVCKVSIDRTNGRVNGTSRVFENFPCYFFCLLHQCFRFYHMVDQAPLQSFFCGNHAGCKDHLVCFSTAHQLCEALRSSVTWNNTQAYFRQAQTRIRRRYADVRTHGQFQTATQSKAVHL